MEREKKTNNKYDQSKAKKMTPIKEVGKIEMD